MLANPFQAHIVRRKGNELRASFDTAPGVAPARWFVLASLQHYT